MNAPSPPLHRLPATSLSRVADLATVGLIPQDQVAALETVAARYAVAITPTMADLIPERGTSGPIGAQFLPTDAELTTTPDETADPLEDAAHSPVPGIVARYADRVLLKPVHVCPVYCRFCFRRSMVGPGGEKALSPAALDAAFAWIAGQQQIWEVVITGGDPFVLSPRRMAHITAKLAAIPHVRIVRWHTRVPVVDPGRITPALVRALKAEDVTTWVALHANHADEFTPAARMAIARLVDAGIPLVSQTVLLAGVNDSIEALETLMRTFVEHRIKPYYLHQGDLAPGTSHFRTPLATGSALTEALRTRASGLAQPVWVQDVPGDAAKRRL